MPSFHLPIKYKRIIADQTLEISFDLSGYKFLFLPGQHFGIGLEKLSKPDPLGSIKLFSIANAPYEPGLVTAMRLSDSGYKQTLNSKEVGDLVYIEGPYGQFTLHQDTKRPAVFLANGIGIVPVRSIATHALIQAKKSPEIIALHSDTTKSRLPYLAELEKLSRKHKTFIYIPTLTQEKPSDWVGETGRINQAMLERHTPFSKNPIYYIVGSPQFVFDMEELVRSLGIKIDSIKTEVFAGY